MNQCPYCEKNIPSQTKRCHECGRKLPLWNRALDVYGGTIPRLFAFVHDHVKPNWLGNALGMAAILLHVTLTMAAIVVLISLITLPLEGQSVDLLEHTVNIIAIVAFLVFWSRIINWVIMKIEKKS